ncbi:MAG: hypothetical protein UX91_C0015G0003 [Candidatus Amesbacteria bacterium GW2011_GWB1_47_19]|nr:MAG: hypothetical protein UX91_C0015G0003 [Candidatus Amesbacteria bacterium GW2011_GWB1_47_19]
MQQLQEFSTRIDRSLLKRVKDYCRKTGRSIMWVVNAALIKFLDNDKD